MADFDKNRFASKNQEWETPLGLFNPLNEEFHFTRDLACNEINKKVENGFTEKDNALSKDWDGVNWLNPPYNKVKNWVMKAYHDTNKLNSVVVMLIQCRTNTNWWHEFVMNAKEVRFIKGRPKFKGNKHGLPLPLAIVVFAKHSEATKYSQQTFEKEGSLK